MSRSLPRIRGGAALLVLWGASGCDSPATSARTVSGPPPVHVELAAVQQTAIRDTVDLVGQLDAEESVVLKPETSGVVATVSFEDGDAAQAGQVLLQLRDGEQRARLHEAAAQLKLAEDELARTRALAARQTVSAAELDRAFATAEAARARRDLAQVELDRMTIRAPFDGLLGARQVSPGDRVSKTTALVRIDAVDRLRLLFSVPELAVTAMRVGSPVALSVAAYPEERFAGEVYFVAPALDVASRRLPLRAWIGNEDHRLRPGMFANIRLEVARRDDALVIPEAALAYDADGPFVWRVGAGDAAQRVPVAIGIRQAGQVEVTNGLAAGDHVVAAGTHKVAPGAVVRDVPPPPPAAATSPGGGAAE
ncbi:efflux RND transporter periplasmic adaptor subunit [bacterium]|nr:efflux RND transporter periplasmic adaptor subunit [bacterium]